MSEKIIFEWVGFGKNNIKTKGIIESESIVKAKLNLKEKGITISKIHKKKKKLAIFKKKVKSEDISIVTKQLETLLDAGVPLLSSIEIIMEGVENEEMKIILIGVKASLQNGATLAESLRKYPDTFDNLFCNLVDSGERSGKLDTMLSKIALYQEKSQNLKKKMKKAMSYPIFVLSLSFLLSMGLLIKVVPQFAATFANLGSELPVFTQKVLDMSEFVQANYLYIFGTVFALIFAFKKALKKPKFSYWLDKKILKMPLIGNVIKFSAIARFCRTMSTTFASGIPILECLTAAAGSTGNAVYTDKVFEIKDRVSEGVRLFEAMKMSEIFPSMVVQMAAIGEESGNIDKMLDKAAISLEDKVDTAVDTMTSMMEPLVMVIIGTLVGGLMIAMYLPMFDLGKAVH